MSPGEIGYRIRQRTRIELERRHWLQRPAPPIDPAIAQTWLDETGGATFYFSTGDRAIYRDQWRIHFPVELAATLDTAEALLAGRIVLFGQSLQLEHPIAWQRDPKTGRDWPDEFWADIDTRDGQRIGGVKWVWELNRHHHLVTLGKAYFLSGDERYAQAVVEQLTHWIATNPTGRGVNWTSALELALRLINWAWALMFIRGSAALSAPALVQILEAATIQAQRIVAHLSAYSSANNHLMGEAAGLAITGLSFPMLPQARQWQSTGLAIMERELAQQIYPDGVPAEQATEYHAFVLDFNLHVWRLAQLHGIPLPTIWRDRLAAASEFLCALMPVSAADAPGDIGGAVPPIGDGDDAWVVRLDDRPQVDNYRSIVASAAVICGRPDFKQIAGRWDEKSAWLLGPEGGETFARQTSKEKASAPASRHFAEGGYCVMQTPGRHLIFDCAPLGYLSTAAHGHADALSLIVALDGQPFLVDPGTYAYQEGGLKRDFLRSTAAHNTLVIDGRDQSQMQGTFLWGRKATTQLLHWNSNPSYDIAIAQHDGFAPEGAIHRRGVLFHKPDWLVVIDWVFKPQAAAEEQNSSTKPDPARHLEQFWHLPPHSRIEIGGEHAALTLPGTADSPGRVVWAWFTGGPNFRLATYEGCDAPMQGWFSSHYGAWEPAPVLALEGTAELPARLVGCFHLATSDVPAQDAHEESGRETYRQDRQDAYSEKRAEMISLLEAVEREVWGR